MFLFAHLTGKSHIRVALFFRRHLHCNIQVVLERITLVKINRAATRILPRYHSAPQTVSQNLDVVLTIREDCRFHCLYPWLFQLTWKATLPRIFSGYLRQSEPKMMFKYSKGIQSSTTLFQTFKLFSKALPIFSKFTCTSLLFCS